MCFLSNVSVQQVVQSVFHVHLEKSLEMEVPFHVKIAEQVSIICLQALLFASGTVTGMLRHPQH